MQVLLEARDLRKRYGTATVVDGLSFAIAPGECLGVIGPNGAGKTTTLRMCLGLTAPDEGSVHFHPGGDAAPPAMPQDALAIKAQLGVVTQFDSLDPDFSCAENLRVFGRYFGLKGAAMAQRIAPLLEFAALTAKADARPGELSGGMRRRLSLARALVNDPRLLLLVEPTTGLDPQARHLMWERLQTLLQQGKSILLTTHFMDEAERLCSRLLVLDHGRKIAEGRPRELIAEHLEREVVEAYGNGALGFSDSLPTTRLLKPLNMYGYSMHRFDLWLLDNKLHNSVASLKFFNVYGPNEYHKGDMRSVACKAYEEVTATGRLRLFKSSCPDYVDGGQMRDFVYVKDCVNLMQWLLQNPQINGILNVGTGKAQSWNSLAHALFAAMGKTPQIDYVDMPEKLRGKYQNFTQADMSWMQEKQCPLAFASLEQGVADYVSNYLSQEDPYLEMLA